MEKDFEIIGRVTRTAYDGSHLEGKPCRIVEIELGCFDNHEIKPWWKFWK